MHPDKEETPMTIIGGRPAKVLHNPGGDIFVLCRRNNGEDVYVPLTAFADALAGQMVGKVVAKIKADANGKANLL